MAVAGERLAPGRGTAAVLVAILGIGVLSVMDAAVKGVAGTVSTWEIVFLRSRRGAQNLRPTTSAGFAVRYVGVG